MKPKVLGIIPASDGSKRVPKKNFKPFAGTTLSGLAIKQVLGAHKLDHIVVNSDAEAVASIAEKYADYGVNFLKRPKELQRILHPLSIICFKPLITMKQRE